METSLNLAHHCQRKADIYSRSGKFSEALLSHQKAAEFLLEAIQTTESPKAKESLQLQYDENIRQQALVLYNQKRYEALCKARENSVIANEEATVQEKENNSISDGISQEHIQHAISRMMEDNDSLLEILLKKPHLKSAIKDETSKSTSLYQSAIKAPKDDKMIIEELQINNEELKKLIKCLLFELERERQENNGLKEKLDKLQRKANSANVWDRKSHLNHDSDFSPKVTNGSEDLPALAPLELPEFDFPISTSDPDTTGCSKNTYSI